MAPHPDRMIPERAIHDVGPGFAEVALGFVTGRLQLGEKNHAVAAAIDALDLRPANFTAAENRRLDRERVITSAQDAPAQRVAVAQVSQRTRAARGGARERDAGKL